MRYWIKRLSGWESLLLISLTLVGGCALTPDGDDLLPDEGPTTLQVYEQHLAGEIAGESADESDNDSESVGSPQPTVVIVGESIAPGARAPSRRSHAALRDLQRDFQRVPNPEIIGYVYPHLTANVPVPGYYTVFPLYEGIHYAEPGEGRLAQETVP